MQTGTIINQYKIISAIGKGGMGEVFSAQDTKLDRKVALKILPPEFALDKDRMSRFVREAKSASALNHPNIITIREIGESDGTHFIATEFIDGKTLNEYVKANPLNYRSALAIAIQVASALDEAHHAGIVHRDIKPDNVMIRSNGLVKILDFGIAKLSTPKTTGEEDATAIKGSTSPGMIIGTANYMSPEQAEGKEVDARTGIFSFGVLIYEMIAGELPFEGESAMKMIGAILKDEPKPLNSEVPTEIKKIISKCLRKNRDTRYQTIKDVGNDLRDVKQELELKNLMERSIGPNQDENKTQILKATTLDEINQTTTNQTTASKPKTKYLAAGLLTLILAVGGFFGYKYFGSQPINISFEGAKITRLTGSGKVDPFQVAISPDGKWLVYINLDGEQQSLWLKQVAIPDSNTQIIPQADVDYLGLAISPDGNYLYYTAAEKNAIAGTLYQVPVLGGTARKLLTGIAGKISFSPDGKQISYVNFSTDSSQLMIASAERTEPRQLVVQKGNEFFISEDGGPEWSPDGKTIAIPIGSRNPIYTRVATVSVATGEINFFSSQKFAWINAVNWLADGKGLVVLAKEKAGFQPNNIWQISYPSGEAKKVSNDLNGYQAVSLTGDSNAMAMVQEIGTSNIWTMPLSDFAQAKQVTSGSDRNTDPVWTPDGKLVYSRTSVDKSDLYLADSQGGGSPKQLTSNAGTDHSPTVSPDGKTIVFGSNRTGNVALWKMEIDGSNPRQLTDNAFDAFPGFSPDGREIIFVRRADKGGILKVSIEGGEPVQLTDKGSSMPRYSPDGKQFACLYQDDPKSPFRLVIFFSSGGSPVKLFDLPQNVVWSSQWLPDGRSIAYIVNKGGVGNIWAQPLEGGKPKQITNFTGENIWSVDFFRDGKQLAVARGTSSSDVVLISGIKK